MVRWFTMHLEGSITWENVVCCNAPERLPDSEKVLVDRNDQFFDNERVQVSASERIQKGRR